MIRRFLRTAAIAIACVITSAHVGSPDAWFEGMAGPYHVTVEVQTAGVVPGVARVFVRAVGDQPQTVTIQANKFDATGGAPPPEPTTRVEGQPRTYMGRLWIMSGGSNSVTVNVAGPKGSGKVVVPVVVVAYSRLKLDKPMGIGLAAMGIFLFAGLVTIVGAAVREGSLAPGETPTPQMKRRARNAMALTSIIVIAMLAGGWRWWNSEDRAYEGNMYKPLASESLISEIGGRTVVQLSISDSAWVHRGDTSWLSRRDVSSWTPLVEDHGKLVHMFLIRDDLSAFAHLHPSTRDSVTFTSGLPPLPAGRYRVFGDIVHESGFTHTLTSTVDVTSAGLPTAVGDPDDSWFTQPVGSSRTASLDSTGTIEWNATGNLTSGEPASLKFTIRNPDGTPARLEPYMGMPAHAVVARRDGSVFVHLHPMGTISMASQMAFEMRQPGDTIRGQLGARLAEAETSSMQHAPVTVGTVSFPYAFPKAGDYRVWVQVKLGGKIRTAAFDAKVGEAKKTD
ncbi:MAG TPA: hypothetical protein VF042_00050 [Gemmatimonadaceae bacterium]